MIRLKCVNPAGKEHLLKFGDIYQGIDCAPKNPKQYFVILPGGPIYFDKKRFEVVGE